MPLYDLKCSEGHRFERAIKLENFSDPIFCACGASATRIISAPRVIVENVGYSCPVTGKWVGSKREHEDNLRRTGSRVLEPGEHEAAARRRAEDDAALDRSIDETIERQWDAMPSAKRESLATELERQGLDVSVERRTA